MNFLLSLKKRNRMAFVDERNVKMERLYVESKNRAKAKYGDGWELLSDVQKENAVFAEVCRTAYAQVTPDVAGEVLFRCVKEHDRTWNAKVVKFKFCSNWCECSYDKGGANFFDDGECDCGVRKHHYHCPSCGGIIQVG